MNNTRTFVAGLRLTGAAALAAAVVSLGAVTGCGSAVGDPGPAATKSESDGGDVKTEKVVKSEAEWREQLTPAQYRVLRQKGTEPAFTGEFWDTKDIGTYHCAACDEALFRSDTKFDAGCGWPSFFEPLPGAKLEEHRDLTLGMVRTEIVCGRCDSHLGHVFDDGPPPTGLRYCINSVSLKFEGDEKRKK